MNTQPPTVQIGSSPARQRVRPERFSAAPARLELELPPTSGDRLEFSLLLACFFLSGVAALLYQTAWMRQFAVVFGTSELAIATVLSAYMAGLAAGSWFAGRAVHRVRRLVLTYGLLEFTIAAGALLVPFGLRMARWILVGTVGGQATLPDAGGWMQPAVYVATTFAILFIPTACMGATLPLLTRHAVHRSDQIGRRVGLLYAINTLGAVVGTVVAGFWLLPRLGLFRTTLCGVGVNVAVFLVAVCLARLEQRRTSGAVANPTPDPVGAQGRDKTPGRATPSPFHDVGWLMPLMFVSGFVSFTYEVLWSRLLGHVIGGSTHAFATMLATFLTGITLGSALASPLARSRRAALTGFLLAQLGTAAASIGLYWFLEAGIGWLAGGDKLQVDPIWNALTCSLVLLPSTICIGMTFPFAVRAITHDPTGAGPVAGRVYAWNTVGGVLGAIMAGFVIVPELSFSGTVQLAVGTNLLLAAAGLLLLPVRGPLKFGAVATAAMVSVMYQPPTPHNLLRTSAMSGAYSDDLVYLGVGRSSTVRVGQSSLFYVLTNNGLPEALISPKGAPTLGLHLHQWLTSLPLIARPEAESLLVIGFGSGGAVELVPSSVREIDVVELEPLVIEANRVCADRRRFDPLADERVNIVLNDARGALTLTDKRYDIIVSQPSHPWTAGASHLYTREFMQLVREHLTDDGVFLQWMNTSFVDDELFRTLGSTVLSVFPNVRLYQPQSNVLFFLASAGDLDLERQLLRTGEPLKSHPEAYSLMGLTGINALATALRLDEDGMRAVCAGAPPNTDDQNRLAFAAAHNRARLAEANLARLLRESDALLNPRSALYNPPDLPLRPATIAGRLHATDFDERAAEYRATQPTAAQGHLVEGVLRARLGDDSGAAIGFRKALGDDPSEADAAYLLCELHVRALAGGTAAADIVETVSNLPQPEATVIQAAIALHRDDFATIQRLDDPLARVSPEASCYGMAVNCRCAWRAAATRSPDRIRLAQEAVVLADRAIAVLPRTQSFLMRFNAVAVLGDPHAVAETALHLGIKLAQVSPDAANEFLTNQGAQVIIPKLERLKYDSRMDQARLAQVRLLFDDLQSAAYATEDGFTESLPY